MREDRDAPAADLAETGDDAVAGIALLLEPEVADVVRGQRAEFLEGARIQQQREALRLANTAAFTGTSPYAEKRSPIAADDSC